MKKTLAALILALFAVGGLAQTTPNTSATVLLSTAGGGGSGTSAFADVVNTTVVTATNPTVETNLMEVAIASASLNQIGSNFRYTGAGRYTTVTVAPTIRFRVYLSATSGSGGVALMDFTTAATTAGVTNSWLITGDVATTAIGASGTVESKWQLADQLGAASDLNPERHLDQNNVVSAAINLTGNLFVRVTALMSLSNASNTVVQRLGYVSYGNRVGAGGGGGAGTVTASGPPASPQIAQWTSPTNLQGIAQVGAAQGGFGVSMAAASGYTKWDGAGNPSTGNIPAGDLPPHTHPGTDINNGTGTQYVGLPSGGTNANLSATGGTSQVLKQASVGAAITVANLANIFDSLANTLRVTNGVTAQKVEIYNTTDSNTTPVNFERGFGNFITGDFYLGRESGGTGTAHHTYITADGTDIRFYPNNPGDPAVVARIARTGGQNYVIPGSDNTTFCGYAAARWAKVGTAQVEIDGANGEQWIQGQAREVLTIAAAASTDTTGNLLPANAVIKSVVVRVTTVIPTAATFTVGDATIAGRFATGVSTAATTTAVGLVHVDQTGTSGPRQTSAAKVRITPNLTPGTATGVVEIVVFYEQFVAPTS